MEEDVVVLSSGDEATSLPGAPRTIGGGNTSAPAPMENRRNGKERGNGLLAHFQVTPRLAGSFSCPVCSRDFRSEREVRLHIEWCLKHDQV